MFQKKITSLPDGRTLFTRRTLILGGAKVALSTLLVGRLGYLGLIKSSHYRNLADGNRIKLQILLPKRGTITDHTGVMLANNITEYRLTLMPYQIQNPDKVLDLMGPLLKLDIKALNTIREDLKIHPKFRSYILHTPLTWDQVCILQVHRPELEGVDIEMGYKRFYPMGYVFAHMVGYVQVPSDQDQVSEELSTLPDYRIGKSGLEKKFDLRLQGKAGYREIEVNAHRKIVRNLNKIESVAGRPLSLSLNAQLQQAVFQKLANIQSGSAVVMDIKTGEIRACVSTPGFNPNLFVNGITHEDWETLNNSIYKPLTNKTIQGTYPPGSIFKLVVALAALKYQKISPIHPFFCRGYLDISNHRFHCVHRAGHGPVTMIQALQMSCDIYFYEIGRLIGIDTIAQVAFDLGLGQETQIEMPYEKKGRIPTPLWKREKLQQPWTIGDTIISSIGQGSMLATPLQMSLLIARLVSGHRIRPTVLKVADPLSLTFDSLGLSTDHLLILKKGMEKAVNDPYGTAYSVRIEDPSTAFAGKTATSQVRRISKRERETRVLRNDEIEWRQRDHSLFAGYGPSRDPKYAICVVVEHGGGGGRVAAPLARDILLEAYKI